MTPEEARALEPGTTPVPWEVKTGHGDDADVWIESSGVTYPDGEPRQICETTFVDNWADLGLMAAAPDMRATIAAQTWEWGTLVPEHDDAPVWWPTEKEARRAADEDAMIRLVRRAVGPVEVVEE